MKKKGIIAAGLTFLFLSAVIVFPVSADEGFADKSINRGEMITKALENIEEQGYDVSDIRAALESGDNETARELMKAFMDGHKGELTPPEGAGEREGRYSASGEAGDRMNTHLDSLEEQGCDVSDIRAALESGDNETARELMKAFMDGHKGELTPPEGAGEREGRYSASGEAGDRMNTHLDSLEEQGCDVSDIRAALESGDNETARELMKAFMDGHKGELTPPEGAGERGNGRFPHRGSCEGTVSE
ncbi:hypothetical protein [Methanoplanus limicola]|uniref:Uncharacterized protein n=1 Tax=Methanoplanus limicola DSM 2279 TaxID=937775 RepID=H1YXP3_9EURY|nr:hypothetical protein [Methanoplanus limicola]EHQ35012.1 hypothetical protein Metlim_0890 [Methanoplanus limicola DSM 2279]